MQQIQQFSNSFASRQSLEQISQLVSQMEHSERNNQPSSNRAMKATRRSNWPGFVKCAINKSTVKSTKQYVWISFQVLFFGQQFGGSFTQPGFTGQNLSAPNFYTTDPI